MHAGVAEIAIPFPFRFVWGRLPSAADLAMLLSPRSASHDPAQPHWLDDSISRRNQKLSRKGPGLIELCQQCETIELWIDPEPNAQLTLIWLLDYLRHHAEVASKLTLVQANVSIATQWGERLAKWRSPAVKILNDHFDAATLAWRAYRQSTPEDWFNLLEGDLGVLPQLHQSVLDLLEELPMKASGLGATEMRILELISAGNSDPFDVFPNLRSPDQCRVFGYWEIGSLLDGLAHCPAPAVAGLNEGPFTLEMHDDRESHARYKSSKLELTALGQAILAGIEDFSRHNPIHRWWGGTELTNDRLWRWDREHRDLIAP